MSIAYEAPARTGEKSKQRDKVIGWIAVVLLAAIVVAVVAGMFPPMTDADRAEMVIDATEGLPQDR